LLRVEWRGFLWCRNKLVKGKLGWEHGFEANEDVITTEVIPDLLYYALSLSSNYNVDLEKAFLERLKVNTKKVDEWKKRGLVPKDASKTW